MTIRGFLLLITLLFIAAPAVAEPLARAETTYVDSAVYADRAGFVAGETTWFALQQKVRPGWHVFWVNPGDAGLPLALNWSLPTGFEAGAILHPAPRYIPVGPLASYAHEGAPIFLVPITAPSDAAPGEVISLAIHASWQTCEEICVPEEARYEFSLPVLPAADAPSSENALVFASARLEVPEPLLDRAARFRSAGEDYELAVTPWFGTAPSGAFFFPEEEGLTVPAGVQKVRIADGGLILAMEPGWIDGPAKETVRGVLRIGAGADERAYAVDATLAPGVAAPVRPASQLTPQPANIVFLLSLAFFGGFLLNAMPCVFPILFVKAASLLGGAHHDRRMTRNHGLLYGAGVVTTFILIGAALMALRAGGQQLGWGFHLQSPGVIGASAYILFIVGLSLAGVFTVGESLAGAGDGLTRKQGAAGAFFTGVLAVAVAAPCIGPLLTAPMSAALTQPPPVAMVIFIAMALGLAAPFMAITMAPGLAKLLPKPGPWMVVFKQALAFPVFAAAAYFAWVFARQTGDGPLAGLFAGLVLLGFAAWAFERSKGEGVRALLLRGLSALAIVLALTPLLSARPEAAAAAPVERYGALIAEPFDRDAIESYRAEGRPVFAIFTAAWCVTCQADKLTVFSGDAMAEAIGQENAVVMVADWTLRDPAISEALAGLGAYGVPFYAVYAPEGGETALAPPISRRAVVKALADASKD